MDERDLELKRFKKRCSQLKRKYVTGWKAVAIIFLVLALVLVPLTGVLQVYDNVIAGSVGGSFWRLANEDENANYYTAQALSAEISAQAQAEGMVLLKNENDALPLPSGAQLCCVAGDLTDSGKQESFANALSQRGFPVAAAADAGECYAAVAVLSRQDDQKNINVLTQPEKELLQGLADKKSAGKLQKIIVLLDTEIAMRLDFLKEDPDSVDAVLWVGAGEASAAVNLLAGTSPSGSLPGTFSCGSIKGNTGIYAGYPYYETRYEDFVMGTGNAGTYDYQAEVVYPFGFGLSYTAFDHSEMGVVYNGETDRFEVTVTVTNTGSVAGRETVQVYAQAPYTDYDKLNRIEKASVNLAGFGKTALLEPGSSETVTVYVDKRDLTSYDAYGTGTYILDAGDYYLTVATDAHDAVNNILAAKGYTAENTDGRMDAAGNAALTYKWVQANLDTDTYATAKNGGSVVNRLTVADGQWLSRQDWVSTLESTPKTLETAQEQAYVPGDYPSVAMPTLGAKNGLKLYDLIGLSFDDPKWQTLLDQLTFEEMAVLLGDAHLWTMPVGSVQAPGARHGELTVNESLLAATFDTALMQEVGKLAGNTALLANETVLHYVGGSFEDGFLTGKIRAAQVQGVASMGVNVVLAGQTEMSGNEQVIRERYLRAYQYAVEDTQTTGVAMTQPMAGVFTGILRQEWGGKGITFSDDVPAAYGVMAGVTAFDTELPNGTAELSQYENDPVIVSTMRQACHYNLYALANSTAMNGIGADTVVKVRRLPLVTVSLVAIAVSWVLFTVFAVLWIRGKKKWQKTVEYLDYRTMKNTLKAEKKG